MDSEEGSIAVLGRQYRDEIGESVDELRKRFEDIVLKAQEYQSRTLELRSTVEHLRGSTIEALEERSSMEGVDLDNMMRTFAWVGVMAMAVSVNAMLARALLAPAIDLMVGPATAFLGAYVILPAVALYYVWQPPAEETHENEVLRRHWLLTFALAEGLLTGTLFSGLVLPGWGPTAAVTPICIAAVLTSQEPFILNDRIRLLGTSLLGSLAVQLMWAAAVGFLASNVVLALLYTTCGFATLQLYIRNVKGKSFSHAYQLLFVYLMLLSDLFVVCAFGSDRKESTAATTTRKR